MKNIDKDVVKSFGEEWNYYKQNKEGDLDNAFLQYFHIFPKELLSNEKVGFDMGCGSGRWGKYVAPKVKILNCIEPSEKALAIAKNNLKKFKNCKFECASSDSNSLEVNSQDFGYCLGVLHHTPNPILGLKSCVSKLKSGSPFLLYLYYRFDNKPKWYYFIWLLTILPRKIISLMPFSFKLILSKLISFFIYLPLATLSRILSRLGLNVENIPLSDYKNKSFYFMQTDAFDRFATKIEKRFTKKEISKMMRESGLINIKFSKTAPFWVCVGYKK